MFPIILPELLIMVTYFKFLSRNPETSSSKALSSALVADLGHRSLPRSSHNVLGLFRDNGKAKETIGFIGIM